MKCIHFKSAPPCLNTITAKNTEWDSLSSEDVQVFNENVTCALYDVGETVFHEGEDCKGLYFLQGGLVAVRKIDAEGTQILIRLANPGDTLGYRPLLAGEKHRASAEVIEQARICFLPLSVTKRLLISSPMLGAGFLERTAQALGEADERFFEAVSLPARVRLIHLLLVLRDRCGNITEDGSLFMELPLTRRDIASMLGIRAESLSRLVHEIEKEGLIHFSGNKITIAHPEALLKELDEGLLPL